MFSEFYAKIFFLDPTTFCVFVMFWFWRQLNCRKFKFKYNRVRTCLMLVCKAWLWNLLSVKHSRLNIKINISECSQMGSKYSKIYISFSLLCMQNCKTKELWGNTRLFFLVISYDILHSVCYRFLELLWSIHPQK